MAIARPTIIGMIIMQLGWQAAGDNRQGVKMLAAHQKQCGALWFCGTFARLTSAAVLLCMLLPLQQVELGLRTKGIAWACVYCFFSLATFAAE
jgi:hypothetical protein